MNDLTTPPFSLSPTSRAGQLSFAEALRAYGNSTDQLVACSRATDGGTGWEYDASAFPGTLTERWDLVCERQLYPNIAQSVFFSGVFAGVLSAGLLADRFGRRRVLLAYVVLFVVSGLCSALSPSFELWVAARWLWGCAEGMKTIKTVLGLELMGGGWLNHSKGSFKFMFSQGGLCPDCIVVLYS